MTDAEIRESIRTGIIEMAEKLSESAMSGDAIGCVLICMNKDSTPSVSINGIRLTECLGLFDWAHEMIKRKLLA